ncbi:hypothetical protein NVV94_01390 [Pseudomonas sp. LS1212]|uniref:hypothetical protein n=1 Tax=Pseudomonas sp. LS1212 TaxID=2972478 RepID=UPI00215CC002|nr:hypothetical protein [Pseudomonas sp. LS1212]UVJ44297.1 hypothetical protein NVV94_01390 [Pseudomonas sp. LS1212]
MPNIRTRLAGLAPACLMKVSAWLYGHPHVVELLTLAAVVGLIALGDKLTKALALQ